MLMKVLVVDMTHGGARIASEFSNILGCEVFAWDIYHTLKDQDKTFLRSKGIKLVDEQFLRSKGIKLVDEQFLKGKGIKLVDEQFLKGNRIKLVDEQFLKDEISFPEDGLMVVAPIHCNLEYPMHLTHHEAVGFLMKDTIQIPVVEVTGVKGKTSVVHMLKEIFQDMNPLILSSTGVEVVENGKTHLLKEDISITPASIMEAWELARNYKDIGIAIFETSLGGTGLADVGILTNIAEDYSIAGGSRKASQAKIQIFKNKMMVCDYHSFSIYYSNFREKTNTFSINGNGNVKASNILFGLYKTVFKVEVNDLKTVSGELLNTSFEASTFAPAPHHLNNVLSAICASLTLNMPLNFIKRGLTNFKGLKGRTSIKMDGEVCIIEEINPGINVTSLKKSFGILGDFDDCAAVFGGKYGVTCEEIDEEAAAEVLNDLDSEVKLILVDELGDGVRRMIKRDFEYCKTVEDALERVAQDGYRNILLIYRSNYSQLTRR
jgi:coenzyme F430 synthetase